MKTIFALFLFASSFPVLAQSAFEGSCVPKQDPLLDGFCGRFPDQLVCESYPMCVWKEKQTHNTSSLSQDVTDP